MDKSFVLTVLCRSLLAPGMPLISLKILKASSMPYLRLYSRDVPIDQKRVIAQKLIEITLRTFHLRTEERNRITVQFISLPQPWTVDGLKPLIARDADATLEVMAHNLTEGKRRAFAEEARATLAHLVPVKPRGRIARLLGIQARRPRQVALQFNELSPAISDPFVVDSEARVA